MEYILATLVVVLMVGVVKIFAPKRQSRRMLNAHFLGTPDITHPFFAGYYEVGERINWFVVTPSVEVSCIEIKAIENDGNISVISFRPMRDDESGILKIFPDSKVVSDDISVLQIKVTEVQGERAQESCFRFAHAL